jgi:peptidyl-prolyl cis-trans isomerase D
MFASIRRHQKWLFIVVSFFTIVSFVVFFSPNQPPVGSGGTGASIGSMGGRPISREDYRNAEVEAQLRIYLTYREWPRNNQMMRQLGIVDREIRTRLLLLEKMRAHDVTVSDAAAAQWIADLFRDPERQVFRKDAYDQFVKQILPQQGMTQRDFERYARHEVGIQHLVSVIGLSGKLVPPQEAELLYRRENQQVDTEAVFVSVSDFTDQVTVEPAALEAYYNTQASLYRIPERVQVQYVRFDAANYLPQAEVRLNQLTNLNEMIENTYQQRDPSTFVDANNQVLTPEAAKAQIREEARREFSLTEARRDAIQLINRMQEIQPATPDTLGQAAAAGGQELQVSAPFSQFEQPQGLNVPEAFGRVAFRLSAQEPFAEQPIVGENAVYVVGFYRRIPSELPPLETVQDRVTQDYRQSTAVQLAHAAGARIQSSITNAVAQGQSFQEAAAQANAMAVDLPPFSQQTPSLPEVPNRGNFSALKNTALALAPGQISQYVPGQDGGFVVHLKARLPVADEQVQANLAEYTRTLRQQRQMEAFNDWLRREIEQARIVLPGDEAQQQARS